MDTTTIGTLISGLSIYLLSRLQYLYQLLYLSVYNNTWRTISDYLHIGLPIILIRLLSYWYMIILDPISPLHLLFTIRLLILLLSY